MLNHVFNAFMVLVLLLAIAFGFLERVALLIRLLGSIRLGSRRSSKPTVVSEDENFLIADRECTLLQQWYSDQPVQRLYGMACTATFSRDGIARLRTGTDAPSNFVREAIWLLIRQHPILSSTIVRDAVTSRATARCTVPKTFSLSVDHPLGNLPVEIISRSDDNAWQGTAEDYMCVDMKEDGWLFRIVFVAPEIAAGSSHSGNFDVDIMIIMHHFITDGLSSTILMRDLLTHLAEETPVPLPVSSPSQLPLVMDELIDIRPTVADLVQALFHELAPSWLRQKPRYFWQGEPVLPAEFTGKQATASSNQIDTSVIPNSHFATITLLQSPHLEELTRIAKREQVSMHTLLTAMTMAVTATLVPREDTDRKTVPLKYVYPIGKAIRSLCHWPRSESATKETFVDNTVGTFISSVDASFDVPVLASQNVRPGAGFYSFLHDVARSLKRSSSSVQDSLSFMGLLNFLPRESWRSWFEEESKLYHRGHKSSVEVSNVGVVPSLPGYTDKSKYVLGIQRMWLLLGRGFSMPAIGVGVATVEHQSLNLTVTCHQGKDGCGCCFEKDLTTHTHHTRHPVRESRSSASGIQYVSGCTAGGHVDLFCERFVHLTDELLAAASK
jgi:hypothetical protein